MRPGPPFVRPPKPFEPPTPRVWSMDAAGRSWDVFGHDRSAWSRSEEAAWDCFCYHIWPRWNEVGVEVFSRSSAGRRLSWSLARGVCTAIHGSADPYVMLRTAPRCLRIAGFGVELVCSVRAMKHWVSRWRRGLRGLRKQNASMVMAHILAGLPALVFHVQSFCVRRRPRARSRMNLSPLNIMAVVRSKSSQHAEDKYWAPSISTFSILTL